MRSRTIVMVMAASIAISTRVRMESLPIKARPRSLAITADPRSPLTQSVSPPSHGVNESRPVLFEAATQ